MFDLIINSMYHHHIELVNAFAVIVSDLIDTWSKMFDLIINTLYHNHIELANVFAVLMSGLIGAFGAIFVGNANNKLQQKLVKEQLEEQRRQWKYDVIVRKEMDEIIKLYYMLCEAEDAFHWFLWDFLSPFGEYPNFYHNTTQEAFRRDCFVKYWNQINEINKVFNSNLLIYQKYHLASKVQIIHSILSMVIFLPIDNTDFNIVYKEGTQQYRLEDQKKIHMQFAKEAHNILKKGKINGYRTDIEEKDILDNYLYVWQEVNNLLIKIKENMEKIIIGYDNYQIPEEEKVGIHKFMPETEVK